MQSRKNLIFFSILGLICLGIHLYSRNAMRAEFGYSRGVFSGFSPVLRSFSGKWDMSLGDFLYLFLVVFLLFRLVRFFYKLLRNGKTSRRKVLQEGLFGTLTFLMVLYIFFNLLWGINYNRKGIAWQLGLKIEKPTKEEIIMLNKELLEKVNFSAQEIEKQGKQAVSDSSVFSGTVEAYGELKKRFPFLAYHPPSIKSSMWGTLGNYAGFTGYYNPFTGEAQVNTTVPSFMHPFIACHEVAHQLGYAKEMEANFVGYLAASNANDHRFRYSACLDLFLFANRDLYRKDSLLAKKFRDSLSPLVIKDLEEWKAFDKNHESFLEPVISEIYDRFLKSNDDPEGMNSYARVTALLTAYRKKTGKI